MRYAQRAPLIDHANQPFGDWGKDFAVIRGENLFASAKLGWCKVGTRPVVVFPSAFFVGWVFAVFTCKFCSGGAIMLFGSGRRRRKGR